MSLGRARAIIAKGRRLRPSPPAQIAAPAPRPSPPPPPPAPRLVRIKPFSWAAKRQHFDLSDVKALEPGEAVVFEFAHAVNIAAYRGAIYRHGHQAGAAFLTRSDGHWLTVTRAS